jgi:hypothetical protein
MNRSQLRGPVRSPDDEATVKRWRRAVCVFYGGISLVLLAAWGGQQLVGHAYRHEAQAAGPSMPTSAIVNPANGRPR